MTIEEAEQKAQSAFEMGLIEYNQIDEYAKHLFKTYRENNSKKDEKSS